MSVFDFFFFELHDKTLKLANSVQPNLDFDLACLHLIDSLSNIQRINNDVEYPRLPS